MYARCMMQNAKCMLLVYNPGFTTCVPKGYNWIPRDNPMYIIGTTRVKNPGSSGYQRESVLNFIRSMHACGRAGGHACIHACGHARGQAGRRAGITVRLIEVSHVLFCLRSYVAVCLVNTSLTIDGDKLCLILYISIVFVDSVMYI